ncbi:MAG: EAL domain-containing protein [Burkholderiales bacterium]|nr:EAL domain-containing protein [Burkholderiales bacterium]
MLSGVLSADIAGAADAVELRVGVYANEPKILLDDSGRPSGIFGDLLLEIARREGWLIKAVPCEWQVCLDALREGRIDLMPDVALSGEREAVFDFHQVPVLHSWSQIYSHPGENISSMLQLQGKRIAVLEGSVQEDFLRRLLREFGVRAVLVPVRSLLEGFAMAADHRVAAVVANHRFGDLHSPDYRLVETPVMFQPSRLYFATGNGRGAEWLAAIDRHMQVWQAVPNSIYFEVLKRWGAPQPATRVPAALWWALAGMVGLLLLVLAITVLLRRQIGVRTRELKSSEERLETILNSVDAYIYIKDLQLRYQYANRKVCDLFGAPPEFVVGRGDEDFFDAKTVEKLRINDERVIAGGERVVEEEVNRSRDGRVTHTYLSVKLPLRDSSGKIHALCGISTDITEQRRLAEEIHQLSFYDPLTHLPNRRQFLERLAEILGHGDPESESEGGGRYGPRPGALLLVNLDHFRMVNETLGHDKGDLLLQDMARRLLQHVGPEDFLGRLNADEFGMLLNVATVDQSRCAQEVERRARHILSDIEQPYYFGEQQHLGTASIGIALFPASEGLTEDILKHAELARDRAKVDGRNTIRFYDPQMQSRMQARAELDADMRLALREGQFLLHYQPMADLDGRFVGSEALVRWRHPLRGVESPAHFIPLAEESGLILPLGRWILEESCRQLVAWERDPETAGRFIAINVSAFQFRHPDFVDQVLAALEQTGANPALLELELTESQLIDNLDEVRGKMTLLKQRGVCFSLDDFGTGYSSLLSLMRLPLDKLKIDQSFIQGLPENAESVAIVRAVVGLGESLGIRVIAEGVETEAQRKALIELGCNYFQGYLIGRPQPATSRTGTC